MFAPIIAIWSLQLYVRTEEMNPWNWPNNSRHFRPIGSQQQPNAVPFFFFILHRSRGRLRAQCLSPPPPTTTKSRLKDDGTPYAMEFIIDYVPHVILPRGDYLKIIISATSLILNLLITQSLYQVPPGRSPIPTARGFCPSRVAGGVAHDVFRNILRIVAVARCAIPGRLI